MNKPVYSAGLRLTAAVLILVMITAVCLSGRGEVLDKTAKKMFPALHVEK